MNQLRKIVFSLFCFLLIAGSAMAVEPGRIWQKATGKEFFLSFLPAVFLNNVGDAEKISNEVLGKQAYNYAKTEEKGKYLLLVPAEYRTEKEYIQLFRQQNGLTEDTIPTREFRIRGQGKGFWLPTMETLPTAAVAANNSAADIKALKAEIAALSSKLNKQAQNPQSKKVLDQMFARIAGLEKILASKVSGEKLDEVIASLKSDLTTYQKEIGGKFTGLETKLAKTDGRLTAVESSVAKNLSSNVWGITLAALALVIASILMYFRFGDKKEVKRVERTLTDAQHQTNIKVGQTEGRVDVLKKIQLDHARELTEHGSAIEGIERQLSPYSFDVEQVSVEALRKLEVQESVMVVVKGNRQSWVLEVRRVDENQFIIEGAVRQKGVDAALQVSCKGVAKAIRLAAEGGRLLDSSVMATAALKAA